MKATNNLIKNLIAALEKKRLKLKLDPQAFHLLLLIWINQTDHDTPVACKDFTGTHSDEIEETPLCLSYGTVLTTFHRLAARQFIHMEKRSIQRGPQCHTASLTDIARAHLDETAN